MKKLLILLLVLPCVLVACGGSAAAPAATAPTAAPAAAAPTAAPAAGPPETETPVGQATGEPIVPTAFPPTSSPATQTPTLDEIAEREYRKLKEGTLAFNPPKEMQLGDVETVQLRISRNPAVTAPTLASGMAADQRNVISKPIKVNTVMEAVLVGDKFNITPQSSQEQAILAVGQAEWRWFVEPMEEGVHALTLRVTVKIDINGEGKAIDFLVDEENVQISVTWWLKASKFLEDNWSNLLGLLIPTGTGVVGIGLYERWKKRRNRENS